MALIVALIMLVAYFQPPTPSISAITATATTTAPPPTPPQIIPVPPQMTASEHDLAEARANNQAPLPASTLTEPTPQITEPDASHAQAQYTADVQNQFSHTASFKVITDSDSPAQPSRVVIGFDLNRDGELQGKSVIQPSSDPERDRDALNMLNRTGFAPFPRVAWSGETTHHFVITLESTAP